MRGGPGELHRALCVLLVAFGQGPEQLHPEGLDRLRGLRGALPAEGAHGQQVAGTGHRHVHEAAILHARVLAGIPLVLLQVFLELLGFLELRDFVGAFQD